MTSKIRTHVRPHGSRYDLRSVTLSRMLWILPLVNAVAVVSTTITLIYYGICVLSWRRARSKMPELGYADGRLPLVGHFFLFLHRCPSPTDLWIQLSDYCDYYREGVVGQIGHQIWLFMCDPEVTEDILSSHEAVEKSYVYRTLSIITDGVFIAPGQRWRKLRKKLNLTFSQKQLDSYYSPTNDKTEKMTNVVLKQLAKSNKYVDMQPYIARCFYDIMTKTHFAVDTDEQIKDEFGIAAIVSHIIETLIQKRLLKPHMHLDFLFQFSEVFKYIEKIKVRPTEYICNELIDKRRLSLEKNKNNEASKDDILVYADLVVDVLKEMNIPISGHSVHMNSSDLLIAGSDTTSIAASCLLYHLACHKDMQQKVYEEVSKAYGPDPTKPLTKQDLASFTYLEMCLNEALRMCSPPGIVRELHKDLDVRKYVIPKGTNLYMVFSSNHYSPRYYERANEYYPEHFTKEAMKNRHKMAFLPFSSGPRNCPGKSFAYVLIKTLAAIIINNYILDTNLREEDIVLKMILMTQHVQGYPIKFTPRHSNVL